MFTSCGVALLAALLSAAEPDPFMRAGQASRAYQAGDYAAAEAGYRALAHDFPSAPGFVLGLGRSLARQGRTAEALDILARAADAGAGAEASTLQEAFGTAADTPEARALLQRFRSNLTPVVRSSLAFRLGEKDLLPESVAYDPVDDTYFVGSLYKRKIVAVKNGVVRDFIPAKRDGLTSVLGMKVEVRRRELWANACNGTSPVMQEPDPRTEGRTAVFRYELGTGRLLGKYEGGRGDETLCFNDLAFSPDGDVYVSAGDGGVFRVVRQTNRLERFAPTPGLFVNGIAISANGKTLYLADHLRGVVLLDVASRDVRPLPTPPGVTLAAIDGLYVHGASLVGVQNGLGEGPERVVQAFLGDDGSRVACVDLLERSHPDYDVPTTGAVVGDELVYVAGSQLNRQDDKGRPWPLDRLRESAVLRLPLHRTCSGGTATARIVLETVWSRAWP
jgi:tetratricopeptide repeat protein